jgi:hypothetical protein
MRTIVTIAAFFVFLIGFTCVAISETDPVKLMPGLHKMLLDNENVRVYEVSAKAGDKIDTHSHPNHVLYFLTDAKAKTTGSDGKVQDIEAKAGTAAWTPGTTHVTEFVTAARVLVVEIKK